MAREFGPTGDTTQDGEGNPPPSHPEPVIDPIEPKDVVHTDPSGLTTIYDT